MEREITAHTESEANSGFKAALIHQSHLVYNTNEELSSEILLLLTYANDVNGSRGDGTTQTGDKARPNIAIIFIKGKVNIS